MMEVVWRIEMLGTIRASNGDIAVSRFRTKRVAALLAYLAINKSRAFSRDELAELLWPEGEPETIRRNLRQALLSLRHAVEPPPLPQGSIILAEQDRLQIASNRIVTDVSEFETLIKQSELQSGPDRIGKLKQAIDLYAGDFLPGFHDEWVQNERLRLEDLLLKAISMLVAECELIEEPEDAIHYLRIAIDHEPLSEALHYNLMQQYMKVNRAASAVKQFEKLEALLREQLDTLPEDDTIRLAESARASIGESIAPNVRRKSQTVESRMAIEPHISRLPIQLTRCFGRDREIDQIVSLLQNNRLVSVLGPAGTGKTRLSIEVAKVRSSTENVFFVPLADLGTAAEIPDQIVEVIRAKHGKTPAERIANAFFDNPGLIVLDNFEHLVEEGASIVSELLISVPKLKFIVTSRQALKNVGEQEFPLAPLPIPISLDIRSQEELSELAKNPSIQLLIDRCQAVRPDIQITKLNAPYLVEICSKLEGIPLAIELAAGLSNAFTPSQITKHLDNRLAALTSRKRDVVERQRSLRAAIDYSYSILSKDQQALFAALSIFRGGFTAKAAASILGGISNVSCLEIILDLQERSLLRSEEHDENGEIRFRLLETFREFGDESLDVETKLNLKLAHANYFTQLGKDFQGINEAATRAMIHAVVDADYGNYIAALEFLVEQNNLDDAVRLLMQLTTLWDVRGTKSLEKRLVHQIANLPTFSEVDPELRIELLRMLGTTYLRDSEFRAAYDACERALEVAIDANIKYRIASCYFGMALNAGLLGEPESCLALCDRVLEHADPNNGILLERTYVSIGSAQWGLGHLSEAEAAFRKAREVSVSFRHGEPDGLIMAHLGGVLLDQNKLDEAMVAASEGIRISKISKNEISYAASLSVIARYHHAKMNFEAALATSFEALQKASEMEIGVYGMETIRRHAYILADSGSLHRSVVLIAASMGTGALETKHQTDEREAVLAHLRTLLSSADFEKAWATGLGMNLGNAFNLALNS